MSICVVCGGHYCERGLACKMPVLNETCRMQKIPSGVPLKLRVFNGCPFSYILWSCYSIPTSYNGGGVLCKFAAAQIRFTDNVKNHKMIKPILETIPPHHLTDEIYRDPLRQAINDAIDIENQIRDQGGLRVSCPSII